MRRAATVMVVIAALAAPAAARAEPAGEPFRFSDGGVTGLRLASAATGSVLAHWGDLNGLHGRVLEPGGPSAPEAALPGKGCSGSQVVADVDSGQYLRVWNQRVVDADPAFGAGVLAQVQTAAGEGVGSPFRVAAAETGFCNYEVATTWNPVKQEYLAVYRRAVAGGGSAYLAQSVTQAGALRGDPFEISRGTVGKPSIAVLPADGAIVAVWSAVVAGAPGATPSTVVQSQLLSPEGIKAGDVRLISDHVSPAGVIENLDPQIGVNPETGQSLIVWNDRYEVYGQLRAANFALAGGVEEARLSSMGSKEPGSLSSSANVVYSPESDQYLVTWQSQRPSIPGPGGVQVYGQLLAGDATEVGTQDFPVSTAAGASEPRSVAVAAQPDFLVAWENRVGAVTGVARNVRPTFDVGILGQASLGNFAFRGLRVRVLCPVACRTRVRLLVSRETARRLRSPRELDVERDQYGGGALIVRLRPPRGLTTRLQRLGRLNATLRVYARYADGRTRAISRRVRLVP